MLSFFACNTIQEKSTSTTKAPAPVAGHFAGGLSEYWYEGKAEVNTYDLQQARYGELHPGQVSLIFVSEDFLTERQVKNDNYTNPRSTPIIKTNMLRRFVTGTYDYAVMTSTFTPVKANEYPHTLKVTTSMQDWCGQSFTQLNYEGGGYWRNQLRSYFEREGDQNERLAASFLEDEVFNRVRSGWQNLPTGKYQVIPSTSYLLMMHKPYEAHPAELTLSDYTGDAFPGKTLKNYTLDFSALGRKLEVFFDTDAPYVVRGWNETVQSRGQTLTTTAKLTHQVREPYWSQNSVADQSRREKLGLDVPQ